MWSRYTVRDFVFGFSRSDVFFENVFPDVVKRQNVVFEILCVSNMSWKNAFTLCCFPSLTPHLISTWCRIKCVAPFFFCVVGFGSLATFLVGPCLREEMLSKFGKPYDADKMAPAKRLAQSVDDLVSQNLISANLGENIIDNIVDAGPDAADVRRYSSHPIPGQTFNARRASKISFAKNAARNFKNRRLKQTFWPKPYIFKAPVWNRKKQSVVYEDIAMWLPLDILDMIWQLGLPEIVCSTTRMDTQSLQHLNEMKSKLLISEPLLEVIGLGIHGDGVPNNYDRTESAHVISLNLPGVGGKFGRMRIPLCVLPSEKVAHETMDAVFDVVAWSLRFLHIGVHPDERHDRSPWDHSDASRKKKTGALGFRAVVVEIRGDWDFYSKTLHFPFHNENDGCCWLCPCRRNQVIADNGCLPVSLGLQLCCWGRYRKCCLAIFCLGKISMVLFNKKIKGYRRDIFQNSSFRCAV